MKTIIHSIGHVLNAVKKSNGLKLYFWHITLSASYFINRLMRILNY